MLLEPVFLEGKTQGRGPMLVLDDAILCCLILFGPKKICWFFVVYMMVFCCSFSAGFYVVQILVSYCSFGTVFCWFYAV